MKYRLFIPLFLLCLYGKSQADAQQVVGSGSVHIPKAVTDSSQSLANYIQQNFKGADAQLYAAYRWVTENIKYDKDSMLYINWSQDTDQKIAATFRRKRGVCDNFASAYADLLRRMNIAAFVVNGLTRQSGAAARTAHSWVAVQLKGEWLFCDPTWDMDYHFTPRYYLNSPSEFIATHWPFDPMWQINQSPISLKDFEAGRGFYSSKVTFENPTDSIKDFLSLNELQQLEATTRRMKTTEQEKNVVKNWAGYNNMNIAIIYGEQDMNLYNDAVASLNKANTHLNQFIEYRNSLFTPARPDNQIQAMLEPVKPALADAYKKMDGIGRVKENFQYDTGELKERLKKTEQKLQQQKDFLQTYLAAPTEQRRQIFY